ncbi:PQQ-binding-like beta-propeller repeat protein [Streptomyces sp. NPDC002888]|uniref:outer membrane protein assembly factor BamB family protein n=1 Tax=Streptomyces sp. NPDC002888 TaxID=3364668 RepID=UPI0036B459E8
MARTARLSVSVGLALSLATACGGGSKDHDDGAEKGRATRSAGPAPTAKPYDPPLKFASQGSIIIAYGDESGGPWSTRLQGTTVYAVSDTEVKAHSVLDGKQLWSVTPQGEPSKDTDYAMPERLGRPTLVSLDGRSALLAAFPVTVPGSGTTPDRSVIELTALAADSGKRLWTTTLERPEEQQEGDVVLAGSDGTVAALKIGMDTDAVTLGIALDTRKPVWTARDFAAEFLDDGVVVGVTDTNSDDSGGISVQGLKLADGAKTWTYPAPELGSAKLDPVGGGLFTVEADPQRVLVESSAALVATSSGRVPDAASGLVQKSDLPLLDCWFDDRAAVVCEAGPKAAETRVVALDAKTFDELWAIEDDDTSRLQPSISTAWHGAVYGKTTNGPVVLDARTGKDRSTDPGATPYQVNAHAGVVKARSGIEIRRATGWAGAISRRVTQFPG